jgi:hypothetical protein
MSTITTFALVADNDTTSYPDDSGYRVAIERGTNAIQRYAKAGLANQNIQYPNSPLNEFNVPFMKFLFLDAYAERIPDTPRVFIKVPNQFNISDFSEYSRTEAIFGSSTDFGMLSDMVFNENRTKSGFDAANFALTASEAMKYAIQKGLASAQGFVQSAGLNNLGQAEFSARSAVNPFTQLLYKGPQYRKYQVPVMIKPKSRDEAKAALDIISVFRIASSPSVPSTTGISVGEKNIGAGSSFLFGYPHLTQFDIQFKTDNLVKILFRSKPCVIDSVAVDYGGQKMTFFEDGVPTEINITIQLTEIVPRTLGDSITDTKQGNTTSTTPGGSSSVTINRTLR